MKEKLTAQEKSWILYDVGNSAFVLMVSTVIPIFFKNITSSAGMTDSMSTAIWGYTLSACTLIVALLGPTLGRLADQKGRKKKFFTFFLMMGVLGCAALGFMNGWVAFLAIFIIARIGFSSSLVFYDSMLTDVTTDERSDVVSSGGYAWGYIGSCIPFTICLVLILMADQIGLSSSMATILSFLIVAVWWFGTTVPLLKNYEQKNYVEKGETSSFSQMIQGLKETLHKISLNKPLMLYLIAYFFYIDGVFTIIDMATSYGKDVGITDTNLLLALLLTQVVAFPFAILFGRLSKKFKTRKLIELCVLGYFLIVLFALQLDKAWEFWFLAVCVAVFQGAIQALSRSYFARLVPKQNSNEYFGFFDIFGKGASFFGTLVMSVVTMIFGSSRIGVGALGVFLLMGYIFLKKIPDNPADL